MGVYTDVRIVIAEEDYDFLMDTVKRNLDDDEDNLLLHTDINESNGIQRYIGWNGLKWNEEFVDCNAICQALTALKEQERSYRFLAFSPDTDWEEMDNFDGQNTKAKLAYPSIIHSFDDDCVYNTMSIQKDWMEEDKKEQKEIVYTFEDLQELLEQQEWNVTFFENEMMIQRFSDAGEDFWIEVEMNNDIPSAIEQIKAYADEFDVDEHVGSWVDYRGENGVPESISELLDDAKDLKEKLNDLYDTLNRTEFKALTFKDVFDDRDDFELWLEDINNWVDPFVMQETIENLVFLEQIYANWEDNSIQASYGKEYDYGGGCYVGGMEMHNSTIINELLKADVTDDNLMFRITQMIMRQDDLGMIEQWIDQNHSHGLFEICEREPVAKWMDDEGNSYEIRHGVQPISPENGQNYKDIFVGTVSDCWSNHYYYDLTEEDDSFSYIYNEKSNINKIMPLVNRYRKEKGLEPLQNIYTENISM